MQLWSPGDAGVGQWVTASWSERCGAEGPRAYVTKQDTGTSGTKTVTAGVDEDCETTEGNIYPESQTPGRRRDTDAPPRRTRRPKGPTPPTRATTGDIPLMPNEDNTDT